MTDVTANQRKTPRVKVRVVVVSSDDEAVKMLLDYPDSEAYLYDYSTNFSEGGIFLKTGKTLPVGKSLLIKFTIPNDINLLEARGVVKWVTTESEAQKDGTDCGIGIEFVGMKEETKQRIKGFIKDIP